MRRLLGLLSRQPPDVLSALKLRGEIWLWRHGLALPLGFVIALLAISLGLVSMNSQVAEHENLELELTRLKAPTTSPVPDVAPGDAAGSAQHILGSSPDFELALQQILELAQAHEISLPRGQYSYASHASACIERTESVLSFSGTYPQTRAWLEDVLRKFPAVSLDRILIERKQVRDRKAEVKVHLTLWRMKAACGGQP